MLKARYLGPRIGAVDPLLSFELPPEMSAVQRSRSLVGISPAHGLCTTPANEWTELLRLERPVSKVLRK